MRNAMCYAIYLHFPVCDVLLHVKAFISYNILSTIRHSSVCGNETVFVFNEPTDPNKCKGLHKTLSHQYKIHRTQMVATGITWLVCLLRENKSFL